MNPKPSGLLALLWAPLAATGAAGGCNPPADCTLGGTAENLLHGIHSIRRGTLALAKPDGVTAIAGNIVVGGGPGRAILRWEANHQVRDLASLTLQGPCLSVLDFDGHSESLGELVLLDNGELRLGGAGAIVRFAGSSLRPWAADKQLVIREWNGSPAGGGSGAVFFGSSEDGLTLAQLAQAAFLNPGGFVPGLYPASILATGEVVPATIDSWFGTWAAGKGLAGAAAAFDADPDGDSIPNGIEFVIGGEPNPAHPGSNSRALLPTVTNDGNNLVFTFARRDEAALLNPVVEFDADMQGEWTAAVDPGNATIEVTPGSPFDIVTVTIPGNANTTLFVRLKVTAP